MAWEDHRLLLSEVVSVCFNGNGNLANLDVSVTDGC